MPFFRRKKISSLDSVPHPLGTIIMKEKLTDADAKFIFDQAAKVLKDSTDTSQIIVTRTTTLITVMTGILLAFLGYIFNSAEKSMKLNNEFYTACIGALYLFTCILYTQQNIRSKTYLLDGSLPIDLFTEEFFSDSIPDDKRIIRYYVSEFENYQFRIEKNSKINEVRWNIYQRTINLLLFFPVFLIVTYGLLSIKL